MLGVSAMTRELQIYGTDGPAVKQARILCPPTSETQKWQKLLKSSSIVRAVKQTVQCAMICTHLGGGGFRDCHKI